MDIENYVHRIGRTGRIGRDGIAIAFATPEQGGLLTDIESMINRLIEPDQIPGEVVHAAAGILAHGSATAPATGSETRRARLGNRG
ncbi:MAG: hypothetical protein U0792_02615 [Gemmataceae bacterium]